jgi:hypothetical protein
MGVSSSDQLDAENMKDVCSSVPCAGNIEKEPGRGGPFVTMEMEDIANMLGSSKGVQVNVKVRVDLSVSE